MARGGKREGAGRKATGRKKVNIMISVLPEEKEKIIKLAEEKNITISQLILDSLKIGLEIEEMPQEIHQK